MLQYNYTPKEWCRSATCLLYKPNKKDPRNIYNYPSIALMNCILEPWTSILANISSPWAEAQGILSDTIYGFRRYQKIYDSLTTYIMMYEDAKMSKKQIYTVCSDFKGAFGGIDHRILFQTMRDLG